MKINYKLLPALAMVSLLVSCGGGSTSSDDSGDHGLPPVNTSNIDTVLRTGDVINTPVTEAELIQATLDEIEATKTTLLDAKVKIFNLNNDGTIKKDGSSLTRISWNPSHDASLFVSTLGKNRPLLYTNAVADNNKTIYKKEIGIIGEKGTGRYLLLGANPLRVEGNEQMNRVMENSLAWLSGRDDLTTAPFKVVIAHLDDSYWFRDETKTREWLEAHYANQVSYNGADVCDGAALDSCLEDSPDLLIISQVSTENDDAEAIASSVNQALRNGTSVLYIHHDGDQKVLGKALFKSVFDVSYHWDNYWKKLTLDSYDPSADINVLSEDLKNIKKLFTHFKNKDYDIDWSTCTDGRGNFGEDLESCNDVESYKSEFLNAALVVKGMLDGFDKQRKNIFSEEGYRIQKLFALTADKFRQSVVFPMDKVRSNHHDFMKSFYADRAVYNYRKTNPMQPDLGNFSRSDFSHIIPTTRVINTLSKRHFSATGAYALPEQTVKVTRSDTSDVIVKVFVNSLRAGSTHQTAKNGYTRPRFLQSTHIEIKSGETIEFTSPYGGPLQLEFSANDLPVDIKFENVGEHPYWASSADNDTFAEKMVAHEYDWAEVSTAGFTVHSTHEKMVKSIDDPKWGGTAAGLAEAIEKYTSNYPHVLAGFKGKGVDVVPEIHDWATVKGLTIETIDIMKHMNADQASCGYGCSGNPYDAYWSFNPIGHGDIHEMGHSMQKKRFEGFENHAATNTFSYYTKSKYFDITGGDPSCQSLPFKTVFETIQSAVGQADVADYLKTNLWDNAGWREPYILKMNAMMHAQKLGKVENGWHVLARVHILEREMRRAKEDWDNKNDSIGFSIYTLDEFNSIGNNDWLVVSYSYAASLDYRNYFDMMGIPYSQKARDQIASFGFEVVPNSLLVSTATGYCKADAYGRLFDRSTLAVDGASVWPE